MMNSVIAAKVEGSDIVLGLKFGDYNKLNADLEIYEEIFKNIGKVVLINTPVNMETYSAVQLSEALISYFTEQ